MTKTATAPQTAVAVFEPGSAGKKIQAAVEDRRGQLAALLSIDEGTERGKAMLDRFVTVALHAITSNDDLLRATTESLVESVRQSAILGLEPTGALGDGAIVVYDVSVQVEEASSSGRGSHMVTRKIPTAQFQPMYRGLLKLARRSDQLTVIDANVVYQGDTFEIDLGTEPRVRHVPWPNSGEPERGGYLGAYAFAKTVTGEMIVEWMTEADIEAVRKSSRAKQSGPWVSFWAEMARKTVLRRLMKRLPLETLAEQAIRLETAAESSAALPDPAAPAQIASAPRARLLSRLGAGQADEQAADPDPAVSVAPGGAQDPAEDPVEEGQVREEELCGSESDPALGEVETCALPKGHEGGRHTSAAGSIWLVSK
jgi:phage RecT family recombinase